MSAGHLAGEVNPLSSGWMDKHMRFWLHKPLSAMTDSEWESLCDHCGKCCLHKLEDEDTGELYFTRVLCKLYDLGNSCCSNYQQRTQMIPDCLSVRQLDRKNYHWLPSTCSYRLLAQSQDLPSWHPLLTGSALSAKYAGVSVCNYAIMESEIDDDLEDHIIDWLE